MNNEPGSALQKASFVLLVFITAALAYLIVRDRLRAQQQCAEAQASEAAQNRLASAEPSKPSPMKSSFAPLRPRGDANVTYTRADRGVTGPGHAGNAAGQSPSTDVAEEFRITGPAVAVTQPVPAAFTSGRGESQSDSVHGRVVLRGTPPPEKPVTLDAMCGRLHPAPMTTRHFVVSEDGGLANVFVYLKEGDIARNATRTLRDPTRIPPALDNSGCEFQPYVVGVRVGQALLIDNWDPILHNVHVLPKVAGNRERNIGLPVAGKTQTIIFEKPEALIQVKCDVHPWMFAYIGVVDHSFFAITDTNGNFALSRDLTPGQYTVAAVHPKAGEVTQRITVVDGPMPPLNFTLDVPKTLAKTETH